MLSAAVRIGRHPETLTRFTVAALVGLALWITVFALAFNAVGVEASSSTITLFYVLQQLGTYVNITPGNLGVQELYSGVLASQLGIGLTFGLVVAAVIRITAYLALLLVGGLLGGFKVLRRTRTAPPG